MPCIGINKVKQLKPLHSADSLQTLNTPEQSCTSLNCKFQVVKANSLTRLETCSKLGFENVCDALQLIKTWSEPIFIKPHRPSLNLGCNRENRASVRTTSFCLFNVSSIQRGTYTAQRLSNGMSSKFSKSMPLMCRASSTEDSP